MERDFSVFPDDPNGNSLWKMAEEGDNLAVAREIDFILVFKNEENALNFGKTLLFNRQKVSMADHEEDKEFPFAIYVHAYLTPNYTEIGEYEALLLEAATPFDGVFDGWACFPAG